MYQQDPQIAEYSDVLDYLFATNKNMTQVIDKLEDPDAWDQVLTDNLIDKQLDMENN